MAGRCCAVPRTTRLAAAYGLVVGVVWGVLALLALLATLCVFPAEQEKLIWLLYFFDPQCGVSAPAFLQRLQPGWPGEEARPVVLRTRALAAARFALAVLRVAASAALIVAERRQWTWRGGRAPPTCFPVYFAWLMTVIADVVLDAVLVPHYAADILHSEGARNVQELLGVRVNVAWADALPAWVSEAPALPPVVLMVVGSRVAPLLWVTEVWAAARVAAAARLLNRQARLTRPRDSQVAITDDSGGSGGGGQWTTVRTRGALPRPAPTSLPQVSVAAAATSDSEDEATRPDSAPAAALRGGPGRRASWARRSLLLDCLPGAVGGGAGGAGGGGGERRWSYVPLATQPSPSPSPEHRRLRPATHSPSHM